MYLSSQRDEVRGPLHDVVALVSNALHTVVPLHAALTDEQDVSERLKLAGRIQVVWEALVASLQEHNAFELAEVVGYYNKLLSVLFSDNDELRLTESDWPLLNEWCERCEHYLAAPDDHERLQQWVSLLDHPYVANILSREDIGALIDAVDNAMKPAPIDDCWSKAHCQESLEIIDALCASDAPILLHDLCDSQQTLWQSVSENMCELDNEEACELIEHYLGLLGELASRQQELVSDVIPDLLMYWHQEFIGYLESPCDEGLEALQEILFDPAWSGQEACDADNEIESALAQEQESVEVSHDAVIDASQLADSVTTIDPQLFSMVSGELLRLLDRVDGEEDGAAVWHNSDAILQNTGRACATVSLFGVAYVLRWVQINIARVEADNEQQLSLLHNFSAQLRAYLEAPQDPARCQALTDLLCAAEWPQSISVDDAEALSEALQCSVVESQVELDALEKKRAMPEDVSLRLPEGVNSDIYRVLLRELPQLTATLSASIQALSADDASLERIREAQRIAHTLKGACNTIGIPGIANLTHSLEDLFEALGDADMAPGEALAADLLDAADCLESMSECILSESDAPESAVAVLQRILDWQFQLQDEGVAPHCKPCVAVPQQAVEPVDEAAPMVQQTQSLASSGIDEMLLTIGESSNLGDRASDKIGLCLDEGQAVRDMSWKLNELASDMDRLINIQTPALRQGQFMQDFDSLEMDQYNELHSSISRMQELTADVRELNARMNGQLLEIRNLLQEQRILHRGQIEHIQNLRQVPVQNIVSRCQRIVRQAAKMTGKEVALSVSGQQTLVDSDMLSDLVEPLMHMLRNAVDHGLEDVETRNQMGKSTVGNISLTFKKERNFLHVTCEDDGSGLDEGGILRKATETGIVDPDQVLSSEQVQRLIFHPGFSTKARSSQVSGRGIGMDVVKNQIAMMNGTVELHSKPGQGLRIEISLMVNLHDARVLLVKHQQQTLALAEHGLEQVISAIDGCIVRDAEGELLYRFGNSHYPVAALGDLLNQGQDTLEEGPVSAILFKDSHGHEVAVPVERVLSTTILMIRPFGDYLKGVYGVVGGVLLGDGEIAPVIDLYELITDSERRKLISSDEQFKDARNEVRKTSALVVDDSLSARKLTAQMMSDSGFDVSTAIDGLDAIEKIEKAKPEILLVDMEMPRMNGIELSRYLRDSEELADIPIVMITSRSSEKHREQATEAGVDRYFVKPFNEDDLMLAIGELLNQQEVAA